jgi:hypothetical protein
VNRLLAVGVVVGGLTLILASATTWLLLTDPVSVSAVADPGGVSRLMARITEVLYQALLTVLRYL